MDGATPEENSTGRASGAIPEENSTGRASGAIPEEGSTGHAWGVAHVVAGVVIGTVASVVAAGIIFAVGGYEETDVLPLSMVAVMQAALWIGLLGVQIGRAHV